MPTTGACTRFGFGLAVNDTGANPDGTNRPSDLGLADQVSDLMREAPVQDGAGDSVSPGDAGTVSFSWSKRLGAASTDEGLKVTTDSAGNVYLTGSFQGTVDFGDQPLASAGQADVFIASYAPNGTHRWSKRFGSTADDRAYALATDSTGHVYLTGEFQGSVSFGGDALASMGASSDIFIASFTSGGAHRWSQHFGDVNFDRGYDVGADTSSNVYLTGAFHGDVDFGGGTRSSSNTGDRDVFVASFNSDGVHRWSRSFGGSAGDEGLGVAVDAAGQVYVTGTFCGTIDFGGAELTCVESGSNSDVFVAGFSAAGVHRWSQRFGGSASDRGRGVATDASGNVYITGDFRDDINFGGETLVGQGNRETYVASFTDSGAHRWSKYLGGPYLDVGSDVTSDLSGNILLTGWFFGEVDIDGTQLTGAGATDGYVASLSHNGTLRWARPIGGSAQDRALGVAAGRNGTLYVTGHFSEVATIGNNTLQSAGSEDIFVLGLAGN